MLRDRLISVRRRQRKKQKIYSLIEISSNQEAENERFRFLNPAATHINYKDKTGNRPTANVDAGQRWANSFQYHSDNLNKKKNIIQQYH